MRNYETKQKAYIEPNAQDTASCLKLYDVIMWILHRFRLMAEITNFEYSDEDENREIVTNIQSLHFTKIFSCLQAMCYKNEKMKKIMWKNKEFFLLERRGLSEQYGELSLISMIIDNPVFLLRDNTLDNFTNNLVKRMSKENFPSVLEIMAKISEASMNSTISTVAMDILTDGPISKSVGNLDEHSYKTFSNLCIILNNLMKSNRTVTMRNHLCEQLTFEKLLTLVFSIAEDYFKKLTDISDIPEKKNPEEEARQTHIKDNREKRRIFYMGTQTESAKKTVKLADIRYVHTNFNEDFTQTYEEVVEELQNCYETFFRIYNLLYFSFFINHVEQNQQLDDLYEKMLKPLNQFLYSKSSNSLENVKILVSKNATGFLKKICSYTAEISHSSEIKISSQSLLDN